MTLTCAECGTELDPDGDIHFDGIEPVCPGCCTFCRSDVEVVSAPLLNGSGT